MWHACEQDDVSLLQRLLDKGLDVNTCIIRSQTLLDVAAKAGHTLVAQTLLDHGFDKGGLNQACQTVIRALSDRVTYDGFTKPKYVRKSRYIDVLKLFMTLDQNLKIDDESEEPLIRAIAPFGDIETLVLLFHGRLVLAEQQGRALRSIVAFCQANPSRVSMVRHILELSYMEDDYLAKYGDALVAAVRQGSQEILSILMPALPSTQTLGRLIHNLFSSVLEPLREAYAVELEKVLSHRDPVHSGWHTRGLVMHLGNLVPKDFPNTTLDVLHFLLGTFEEIEERTIQTVFEQAVQINHLQSAKAILYHAAKQNQHGQSGSKVLTNCFYIRCRSFWMTV